MFHTLTLQDIRTQGSKCFRKEVTSFLIVDSKPIAAIVPMEEYALYEEMMEECEDRAALKRRRSEKPIPFTSLSDLQK